MDYSEYLDGFKEYLDDLAAEHVANTERRRNRYLSDHFRHPPIGRKCNARRKKKRGGGLCQRPAGWGTFHAGWGTCKLHCGSTRSGTYAAIMQSCAAFNETARRREEEELDSLFANAEADFNEFLRRSERQIEKHDALRRARKPRSGAAVSPELAGEITERRAEGLSFRAIARELNERGVRTARGGACWYSSTVRSAVRTRERELAAQRSAASEQLTAPR